MLTLMYDPRAKYIYGSFKRTSFGRLPVDETVLGNTPSVAIKQCWYEANNAAGYRIVHDNHTQIVKLTAEINCLRWASALMQLVYDFIASFTTEQDPPFSIPNMRYVKSALAIAVDTHETFLLEEVIHDSSDGNFVKYIGNSSVEPLGILEGEEVHRAKFLSFCQHVQYVKTKSHAIIGDFQGRTCLLITEHNLIFFILKKAGKLY